MRLVLFLGLCAVATTSGRLFWAKASTATLPTPSHHSPLHKGRWASLLHHRISDAEHSRRFMEDTAKDVAKLKASQQAALVKLREMVYGDGVDAKRQQVADQLVVCGNRDAMLLAFLRRKDFDVVVAYNSLDRVINWRIEHNIEDIFLDNRLPPEKIKKHRECWPTAIYKDNEGHPIFVDRMGILDLNKLRRNPVALTFHDMVTYYIQTMESRRRLLFPHLSFESGRHVTKFTSIVDVSTFGPQHFGVDALRFMQEMGKVFEGNYEDMLDKLYIINVGWLFHRIWGIIKRLMSPDTLSRLRILSKDQSFEELCKIMPADAASAVCDAPLEHERHDEAELHKYMDAAAKNGHHRRRWF